MKSMKHEHVQKLNSIPKNLSVGRYIFLYFQVEVKEFSTKSASTSQQEAARHFEGPPVSEIIIRTATADPKTTEVLCLWQNRL